MSKLCIGELSCAGHDGMLAPDASVADRKAFSTTSLLLTSDYRQS